LAAFFATFAVKIFARLRKIKALTAKTQRTSAKDAEISTSINHSRLPNAIQPKLPVDYPTMSRRNFFGLFLLLLAAVSPALAAFRRFPRSQGFNLRHDYRYQVLFRRFLKKKSWPVFFSCTAQASAGRRADSDRRRHRHAIGEELALPVLVVMPQSRKKKSGTSPNGGASAGGARRIIKDFIVRRNRIYLSGLSMADTALGIAANHPALCALVPICPACAAKDWPQLSVASPATGQPDPTPNRPPRASRRSGCSTEMPIPPSRYRIPSLPSPQAANSKFNTASNPVSDQFLGSGLCRARTRAWLLEQSQSIGASDFRPFIWRRPSVRNRHAKILGFIS